MRERHHQHAHREDVEVRHLRERAERPRRPPELLGRIAQDHRWAGEPFRRAVRGAMTDLPADAAKKLLTAARKYVEPEPGGLGWLGDCYLAAGMKAEANNCFSQATAARTAAPDDWLRLAVRTAEAGSPEAGAKVLQAARGKMPVPVFFAVAAAFSESKATPTDWAPPSRSFDGVRVAMTGKWGGGDVAVARLADPATPAHPLGGGMLAWGRGGWISDAAQIDAVLIVDTDEASERFRETAGAWGKWQAGPFSGRVEAYGQFGSSGDASIGAFMAGGQVTWASPGPWKPALTVWYAGNWSRISRYVTGVRAPSKIITRSSSRLLRSPRADCTSSLPFPLLDIGDRF